MIEIDRTSTSPISDQLAIQIKYLIAIGTYKSREKLPSTRELAEQLDISFHTVRKAYHNLVAEGVVSSKKGSGFEVLPTDWRLNEEIMEKGAGIIQDAIKQLVGLGLSNQDIEYILEEQIAYSGLGDAAPKVVFAVPFDELSENASKYLSKRLQQDITPSTIRGLLRHQDADYVITPHRFISQVQQNLTESSVVGVHLYPSNKTVELIATLLPSQTVGLITRKLESIKPISTEMQRLSGFTGPIVATSIESAGSDLSGFMSEIDLLIYTAGCKRKLRAYLDSKKHAEIEYVLSRESLQTIDKIVARRKIGTE